MDVVLASLALTLTSLIVLWIRLRKKRLSLFKRYGIPGPEPSFWTGNVKDIIDKREACVSEYVKKYGDIVGFFLGTKPMLIVTDKELMKTIQVKEFASFTDKDLILPDGGMPQPEILKGMPASKGEEWKRKRALVSPLFSSNKLKKIMPIFNEASDIFLKIIEKECAKEYTNVVLKFKNLIMDVITKSGLGIDTGVQQSENDKFLQSARLFLSSDTSDMLAVLSLCFPELEPLPTKLRNLRDTLRHICGRPSVRTVLTRVQEVMDYRRKHNKKRADMLQGLMDEKAETRRLLLIKNEELAASYDNENVENTEENKHDLSSSSSEKIFLSDVSIRGTAAILLIAGLDTTSITLSYLVFYLAKYQEIQDRLREEVNSQMAGKKDITYEDLFKLPYMDQVISETLRLHPANMLTVNREVIEPFKYNDLIIPSGVTVIMPSLYLHMNPDDWSQPEEFQPERFSSENKDRINPYIYQPFGNGPRNCIGMKFAKVVIKLVLAKLIKSYNLKSYNSKGLEINRAIFIDHPKEVLVKIYPVSC